MIGPGSSPRPSSVRASSAARSRELNTSVIGTLPNGLTAHYRVHRSPGKALDGGIVRFSATGSRLWSSRDELPHFIISRQSPQLNTLTSRVATLVSDELGSGSQFPFEAGHRAADDHPGCPAVLRLPAVPRPLGQRRCRQGWTARPCFCFADADSCEAGVPGPFPATPGSGGVDSASVSRDGGAGERPRAGAVREHQPREGP